MNVSILVMLAAPYLLFAGICGLMVRAIRRARRERIITGETGDVATRPDAASPGDRSDPSSA